MVEGERAVANLGVLHGRLRPCFARRKPFEQAGKYMSGLMSDLSRKNGWTLAEHVGDRTPDRMQRLLNDAVWDHDRVQGWCGGSWSSSSVISRCGWGRWMSPVRRSRANRLRVPSGSTWDVRAGWRTG